ncbi:hypothetical protein SacmaDRAFT_3240 [Saccharomonospora marina XMU15]|uniref:Uncharacterized protein n=1 Tax=Saccharomonospora marina XMU15 TaxID=882083 RepID=H5X9M7_9PSEU|nr:hypothetical protein [Saccharomonospora marina]EHR51465.1 hypothetical protein SacmaDRAFT_3240 [Saccharomonospora marina XMU15]
MAATGIDEVESAVRDVASEYPPALLDKAVKDTRRQVFQVGLAHRLASAGTSRTSVAG